MASKVILSQLLVIFIILKDSTTTAQCGHKPLNSSQISPGNIIHHTQARSKSVRLAYAPLRIHLEYEPSFEELSDFIDIKNEILEPAKTRLESIIKVKNALNGILRVNRHCRSGEFVYTDNGKIACKKGCSKTECDGYEIPERYLNKCFEVKNNKFVHTGAEGRGVTDVDIVLLVGVHICKEGIALIGRSCFLEAELDRPIFGVLSLCGGAIKPGQNVHYSRLLVQHEIIHALGFSADKFAYYRYQNGLPIVPRDMNNLPNRGRINSLNSLQWNDKIAKEIVRTRSSVHGPQSEKVYSVSLPTVLETARIHFNCPTLEGVDVDSSASHFDAYYLENELMTPIMTHSTNELTKFTLSMLKDTGWYDADLLTEDGYTYGKNNGCDMIFNGCYKFMNNQKAKNLSPIPFCNKVYTYGDVYKCSEDRKYYQYCNIIKHKSLDKKYQYFTHLNGVPDNEVHLYGGSMVENKFCPIIQALPFSRSICTQPFNIPFEEQQNIMPSYYGADSACFEYDISIPSELSDKYYGASCQKYSVDQEKNTFSIYFLEKIIECPSKNPILFVTREKYNITFICPMASGFTGDRSSVINYSNKLRISGSITAFCLILSRFS